MREKNIYGVSTVQRSFLYWVFDKEIKGTYKDVVKRALINGGYSESEKEVLSDLHTGWGDDYLKWKRKKIYDERFKGNKVFHNSSSRIYHISAFYRNQVMITREELQFTYSWEDFLNLIKDNTFTVV